MKLTKRGTKLGISVTMLAAWAVVAAAQDVAAGQEVVHAASRTEAGITSAAITENADAAAAAPAVPGSFDEVVDRMVEREHLLLAQMRNLRPLVETYVQDLKADADGNPVPVHDQYFLGRLDLSEGPEDVSFLSQSGGRGPLGKLSDLFSLRFQPKGFAQMVVLDTDLYKKNYTFTYVRREFLGEVRCIVMDAQPIADAPPGRFEGRIWVEDQGYNIVRFNGTYSGHPSNGFYLHFDSWRLNLHPGMWLPAYVYSEESDLDSGSGHFHVKAQTRLWGYDLKAAVKSRNEEFTQIVVDSQIKDQSGATADPSPVAAERMWEKQAEDNVVERLQNVGLLAPAGDVDAVLEAVVNNLVISNNLALQSDVHCRVLITAPLESFTIGHTIVVSRGLLDVLPDEAALAMVLAHELSHIVLGHQFDAKLAFNDRMFFPDEQSFRRLDFKRRPADEDAADAKALELLKNSPYKEKLATAGLFLRALQQRAPDLPNLIRPHLGNSFAVGTNTRMEALLSSAPQLDAQRIDQIAALPLGGRIKLDPWSDQVELAKAQPVTLALSREKMPFEITPFFPFLTRLANDRGEKLVSAGSGSK
ncbi:MAG TPA: M48 family metalloprotease [Terriglobales bacterium]|nr:M48 family metalloprotease [Terriglobales bacterium]